MPAITTFSSLVGATLVGVEGAKRESEQIVFALADGRKLVMGHNQSCCETVQVEDICGDVADLIGQPIALAEEVSNADWPSDIKDRALDSYTWTFYKLATNNGSVTIRWLGQSNGAYSESVDLSWETPESRSQPLGGATPMSEHQKQKPLFLSLSPQQARALVRVLAIAVDEDQEAIDAIHCMAAELLGDEETSESAPELPICCAYVDDGSN